MIVINEEISRILIGNEFSVTWTITKCSGEEEIISDNASLYVKNVFSIKRKEYSKVKNVLTIDFNGQELKECGSYDLILVDGDTKRYVSKSSFYITDNPLEVNCNE